MTMREYFTPGIEHDAFNPQMIGRTVRVKAYDDSGPEEPNVTIVGVLSIYAEARDEDDEVHTVFYVAGAEQDNNVGPGARYTVEVF